MDMLRHHNQFFHCVVHQVDHLRGYCNPTHQKIWSCCKDLLQATWCRVHPWPLRIKSFHNLRARWSPWSQILHQICLMINSSSWGCKAATWVAMRSSFNIWNRVTMETNLCICDPKITKDVEDAIHDEHCGTWGMDGATKPLDEVHVTGDNHKQLHQTSKIRNYTCKTQKKHMPQATRFTTKSLLTTNKEKL